MISLEAKMDDKKGKNVPWMIAQILRFAVNHNMMKEDARLKESMS